MSQPEASDFDAVLREEREEVLGAEAPPSSLDLADPTPRHTDLGAQLLLGQTERVSEQPKRRVHRMGKLYRLARLGKLERRESTQVCAVSYV